MSTVNPVMLNGARIGPNETAPVKADDVIEIGDFAVQILQVHQAQPTPGAPPPRADACIAFRLRLGRKRRYNAGRRSVPRAGRSAAAQAAVGGATRSRPPILSRWRRRRSTAPTA
jgi:hypothetical protein